MTREYVMTVIAVFVVLGAVIILGGAIVAVAQGTAQLRCESTWPGRNPEWTPFVGCMIDTDAGRIPAKNFMVTK